MVLIEDGRTSVVAGLSINIIFMFLKFIIFLYSHVNLYFTDAIDSFADSFVIFLILIFLKYNFNNKLTFLNMDIMFFCQWSVILIFRVIIFLDQISDLIKPEPRENGLLLIIVSVIVLAGSVAVIFIFVDEDDVIKCFIDKNEKELRIKYREQQSSVGGKKKSDPMILPILAEAIDNLVTTFIALVVGILLYLNIAVEYLYLIDDLGNMVVSCIMFYIACNGLTALIEKYRAKSQFSTIYEISSTIITNNHTVETTTDSMTEHILKYNSSGC